MAKILYFSTEYARLYGLHEAIVLQNLVFWIAKNREAGRNFYDGRYWTYNTCAAFAKLFECLTPKQVQRSLNSLVGQGIIIKGRYNAHKNDRTLWYALFNESAFLSGFTIPNSEDAVDHTNDKKLPTPLSRKSMVTNREMELPEEDIPLSNSGLSLTDSKPDFKTIKKRKSTSRPDNLRQSNKSKPQSGVLYYGCENTLCGHLICVTIQDHRYTSYNNGKIPCPHCKSEYDPKKFSSTPFTQR